MTFLRKLSDLREYGPNGEWNPEKKDALKGREGEQQQWSGPWFPDLQPLAEPPWRGGWFPNKPGKLDDNEETEYASSKSLYDSEHGIRMGIKDPSCDNGKVSVRFLKLCVATDL